ncbi:MAG: lipopolysaccharide biosynthesis protein [Candidatus Paceibacterota bacterium]
MSTANEAVVPGPESGRRLRGLRGRVDRFLSQQNGFFRQVLMLSSGTLASQLILLISGIGLARIYDPNQFGSLSIFISVLTLMSVMAAWRYEAAIPLPAKVEEAAELLALSLLVLGAMTASSIAIVWAWGTRIIAFLPQGELLETCLWLVPLGLLSTGLHRICGSWMVREGNFRGIAGNSIVQTLLQVTSQIGFGVFSGTTLGLISGDVLGRTGGACTLWRRCWHSCREPLRSVHPQNLPTIARRYWRFPFISSWAALVNAACNYLPHILIALYFGLGVAGLFALAQRVITMPCTLLGHSVAKVYLRECARLRHERKDLKQLFWRTVLSQSLTACLVIMLLVAPAPWYFGWVFGNEWAEAGWYAWPLAAVLFIRLIALPLGTTLDVFERQDLHLLRESIRAAAVVTAILLSAALRTSPFVAIGLFSIAACLANGVGIFVVWNLIRKDEGLVQS